VAVGQHHKQTFQMYVTWQRPQQAADKWQLMVHSEITETGYTHVLLKQSLCFMKPTSYNKCHYYYFVNKLRFILYIKWSL